MDATCVTSQEIKDAYSVCRKSRLSPPPSPARPSAPRPMYLARSNQLRYWAEPAGIFWALDKYVTFCLHLCISCIPQLTSTAEGYHNHGFNTAQAPYSFSDTSTSVGDLQEKPSRRRHREINSSIRSRGKGRGGGRRGPSDGGRGGNHKQRRVRSSSSTSSAKDAKIRIIIQAINEASEVGLSEDVPGIVSDARAAGVPIDAR